MTTKFSLLASVCSSVLMLGTNAGYAQSIDMNFQVCQTGSFNCFPGGESYIGPGTNAETSGVGIVAEAGNSYTNDAYDGYGYIYGAASTSGPQTFNITAYATDFNGLNATRQTQTYRAVTTLPGNSVRWFDSFTNNTGANINATIAFGGNLGSDTNTQILSQGATYVVHGQGAPGNASSDPVIASVWGNNAYAAAITPTIANGQDSFYIPFAISVAPGATVSIMNLDILVGSIGRNTDAGGLIYASDALLAAQRADYFINSPIFDGLTAGQIATLINWKVNVGTGLDGADGLFELGIAAKRGFANALSRTIKQDNGQSSTTVSRSSMAGGSSDTFAVADGGKVFVFGDYLDGKTDLTSGTLDYQGNVFGGGFEREIGNGVTAGVALGFTNSKGDISPTYSSIKNKQRVVMPYLRGSLQNGFKYETSLFAATENWDYQRTAGAGTATGDVSGHSLGAAVKISKDIPMASSTVTPFAGLDYMRTSVKGFTETGAGSANLTVPGYSAKSLEASLGADVSHRFVTDSGSEVTLFASAALRSELLGSSSVTSTFATGTTTFNNAVGGGTGTYGTLGLGVTVAVNDNAKLSVSYGGAYGKSTRQNSLSLNLNNRF